MAEQINNIPVWKVAGTTLTTDGVSKGVSSANSTFKPAKPENLVRPQGVKPPPAGRTR
jgi:hypothetical protein